MLQLVEQAGVLDRDARQRGEVRDQLDLLIGEGTHLLLTPLGKLVVADDTFAARPRAHPARLKD